MRCVKTTARYIVQKFPNLTRCYTLRNRRRMRTGALTLIGLFLFLIVVCFRYRDARSQDYYKDRGVKKAFADKSAFVTTLPHREWRRNSSVKRILRWTGFLFDRTWEGTDDRYFAPCAESRCTMTNDRALLDQSDAVLFHAHDIFNFWRGHAMPDHRLPFQVWLLYNIEPPPPAHLSTWPRWRGSSTGRQATVWIQTSLNYSVNHALRNHRMAAWMTSNCYDHNRRQLLVRKLKHLLGDDLDLYGACNNLRCPETICADTISNYKFYLALENANCRDYVTEKFWAALARQQVPVVLGGASSDDYRKVAPPNSFLHVADFSSVEDLVRYLRYLSHNHTAYNRHLAWTRHYHIHSELPARRNWWCDLCLTLHDQARPPQVYRDLQGWYQEDVCPQWTLASQLSRLVDGVKFKMGLA
ncbi:hypothetical protein ACOMHN_013860 [Nucella lapillus]